MECQSQITPLLTQSAAVLFRLLLLTILHLLCKVDLCLSLSVFFCLSRALPDKTHRQVKAIWKALQLARTDMINIDSCTVIRPVFSLLVF